VASRTSPTVRRRILAAKLNELRSGQKINRKTAADHIGVAETTITRIENGTGKASVSVVRSLLDLYGVTDPGDRALFEELARDASKRDWYHKHKGIIPAQFEMYFALETEAAEIRCFEQGIVPGLLQTADYYRAYLTTSPMAVPPETLDKRIEFRLARQERILGASGPRLWVVLDEAALRRPVGGSKVMRSQLAHLRELGERGVTVQVYPFSAGAHQAQDGGFIILEFPNRSHDDVVYAESHAGTHYFEAEDVVDRYNLVFNHLRAGALSSEQTMVLLAEAERAIE
jgi:DNA-binding XRE family transcriptional regulator